MSNRPKIDSLGTPLVKLETEEEEIPSSIKDAKGEGTRKNKTGLRDEEKDSNDEVRRIYRDGQTESHNGTVEV